MTTNDYAEDKFLIILEKQKFIRAVIKIKSSNQILFHYFHIIHYNVTLNVTVFIYITFNTPLLWTDCQPCLFVISKLRYLSIFLLYTLISKSKQSFLDQDRFFLSCLFLQMLRKYHKITLPRTL